ncbi:MAG: hypothetical protein K2Y29_15980 [Beijerinckiaceae bacterium]|nr:hypothetical protein [Beijerinckiaceae bacterium]
MTSQSSPQRLYEPDRERGELVVSVSRSKERRATRAVVCAESVVASFNTWAFKREQPDSPAGLLAQVAKSIALSQPVRFVLYWGKGPRNAAGDKEVACLDFLGQMQERIRQVYAPGAQITIVFTDTHAALNGHKLLDAAAYFKSVAAILPATGYDFCHLGSIVRDARPLLADFDPEAETLDTELQVDLVSSAQKWYRGPGSAEEGAIAYYRANLVERKAMELSFPDSIFVTFNGSALRGLFPETLPIFYMYSLRKGFAVKPWFLA